MIRKLDKTEYEQAAALALDVYIQCGADDFNEEGLISFKSFIFSEQLMNELAIYGAFEDKHLVGIMGTKHEGKHLSLFFIRKEHQCKGIGKQLFCFAINDCPVDEMTVNSSTYAIRFYQSLGFERTNEKQCTNGITYTPMILKRKAKISSIAPCGMDCALCHAFQDAKSLAPVVEARQEKFGKVAKTVSFFHAIRKVLLF